MIRTNRFAAATSLLLTILTAIVGCKSSTSDPGTANLTSLQGSWKITGITIDPAYMGVTNLAAGLQVLGETCINDAVVTFNTNGTITNNTTTQASCQNAPRTKQLISTFFGTTTTYTESASQATLRTGTQTVVASEVFTSTTATLTAKLPTDPVGNAVPTTYVVILTRQ